MLSRHDERILLRSTPFLPFAVLHEEDRVFERENFVTEKPLRKKSPSGCVVSRSRSLPFTADSCCSDGLGRRDGQEGGAQSMRISCIFSNLPFLVWKTTPIPSSRCSSGVFSSRLTACVNTPAVVLPECYQAYHGLCRLGHTSVHSDSGSCAWGLERVRAAKCFTAARRAVYDDVALAVQHDDPR